MAENLIIGNLGETAACKYLTENGYMIIQRNFKCKTGEIDIIALKNGCTVFVEVKTRKNRNYGSAAEFVDYRKQLKIKRAAMYYLKRDDVDMRFDVIEIYHNKGVVSEINHIKHAF